MQNKVELSSFAEVGIVRAGTNHEHIPARNPQFAKVFHRFRRGQVYGVRRWCARDPFPGVTALPASQHPYAHAHNAPAQYTDPTGRLIFIPIALAAVASLGITAGDVAFAAVAAVGITATIARICILLEEQTDYVDRTGNRAGHIWDGDPNGPGGGHRAGTGRPGKSEFPPNWSDAKVLDAISDVTTDPSAGSRPGQSGRTLVTGTRDGIDIEVVVNSDETINTGYPTNVPKNP